MSTPIKVPKRKSSITDSTPSKKQKKDRPEFVYSQEELIQCVRHRHASTQQEAEALGCRLPEGLSPDFVSEPKVSYERSRMCFIKAKIDPLEPKDVFEVRVAHQGVFRFTKEAFLKTFPHIAKSASYLGLNSKKEHDMTPIPAFAWFFLLPGSAPASGSTPAVKEKKGKAHKSSEAEEQEGSESESDVDFEETEKSPKTPKTKKATKTGTPASSAKKEKTTPATSEKRMTAKRTGPKQKPKIESEGEEEKEEKEKDTSAEMEQDGGSNATTTTTELNTSLSSPHTDGDALADTSLQQEDGADGEAKATTTTTTGEPEFVSVYGVGTLDPNADPRNLVMYLKMSNGKVTRRPLSEFRRTHPQELIDYLLSRSKATTAKKQTQTGRKKN